MNQPPAGTPNVPTSVTATGTRGYANISFISAPMWTTVRSQHASCFALCRLSGVLALASAPCVPRMFTIVDVDGRLPGSVSVATMQGATVRVKIINAVTLVDEAYAGAHGVLPFTTNPATAPYVVSDVTHWHAIVRNANNQAGTWGSPIPHAGQWRFQITMVRWHTPGSCGASALPASQASF